MTETIMTTTTDDQMQTDHVDVNYISRNGNNNLYKGKVNLSTNNVNENVTTTSGATGDGADENTMGVTATIGNSSGEISPTAPLSRASRSVETFQDMEGVVKTLRAVRVKLNDVKERLERANEKINESFQNRDEAEKDAEQKKMAYLRVLRSTWDNKKQPHSSSAPAFSTSGGGLQRLKSIYLKAKRVFEEYNWRYNDQVRKRDILEEELGLLQKSTAEIEIQKNRLSMQSLQDYENYASRVVKSGVKDIRRTFSRLINYYNEYTRTDNLELLESTALLAAELLPQFQTEHDVLVAARVPVEHILHFAMEDYNHTNPDNARSLSDVLANLEAIPEQFGSHIVKPTRKSLKDELELYKFLIEVDKSQTRVQNILYHVKPEYIKLLTHRKKSLQQLITERPQDSSLLERLNETDGTISYFEQL